MSPPTLDTFLQAVLFELRETYHLRDELARLLVLQSPEVIAVEFQSFDPPQAARALLLCAIEDRTLRVCPAA